MSFTSLYDYISRSRNQSLISLKTLIDDTGLQQVFKSSKPRRMFFEPKDAEVRLLKEEFNTSRSAVVPKILNLLALPALASKADIERLNRDVQFESGKRAKASIDSKGNALIGDLVITLNNGLLGESFDNFVIVSAGSIKNIVQGSASKSLNDHLKDTLDHLSSIATKAESIAYLKTLSTKFFCNLQAAVYKQDQQALEAFSVIRCLALHHHLELSYLAILCAGAIFKHLQICGYIEDLIEWECQPEQITIFNQCIAGSYPSLYTTRDDEHEAFYNAMMEYRSDETFGELSDNTEACADISNKIQLLASHNIIFGFQHIYPECLHEVYKLHPGLLAKYIELTGVIGFIYLDTDSELINHNLFNSLRLNYVPYLECDPKKVFNLSEYEEMCVSGNEVGAAFCKRIVYQFPFPTGVLNLSVYKSTPRIGGFDLDQVKDVIDEMDSKASDDIKHLVNKLKELLYNNE